VDFVLPKQRKSITTGAKEKVIFVEQTGEKAVTVSPNEEKTTIVTPNGAAETTVTLDRAEESWFSAFSHKIPMIFFISSRSACSFSVSSKNFR
jgi:hypothetical protein